MMDTEAPVFLDERTSFTVSAIPGNSGPQPEKCGSVTQDSRPGS